MVLDDFVHMTVLFVFDFADDGLTLQLQLVLHDVHLVLLPCSEQIRLSLMLHPLLPHLLVILLQQCIPVVQVLLLQLLGLHHHRPPVLLQLPLLNAVFVLVHLQPCLLLLLLVH